VDDDPKPRRLKSSDRIVCQGWRCTELATWARWSGRYCTDHAIRAGWLPGPVIQPGTQLAISTVSGRPGWGWA
jgi:phospholipase/lecithinase/hemolysin